MSEVLTEYPLDLPSFFHTKLEAPWRPTHAPPIQTYLSLVKAKKHNGPTRNWQ